jgi:hypothetical protein
MPDQVRVPDPLPNRKPTVSAPLPIKMSQQDLLLNYHDYAPPSTPHNAGGVLLLSRSASPLKRIPSQDWRLLPPGTSPHSSGFSEGSCGSSPARSPKDLRSQPLDDDVIAASSSGSSPERPLSLVIRKNRTHYADPNSNVPEYTVHQLGVPYASPRYMPYAPTAAAAVEEEEGHDSGTEEDLEPTLVISEPELEEEEQLIARDLSLKKTPAGDSLQSGYIRVKKTTEAEEEEQEGEDNKDDEVKAEAVIIKESAAVIKIRDFARFSANTSEDYQVKGPTAEPVGESVAEAAAGAADDNMSDLSSECPESLSSVDTWQSSSFTEGRPFVPGTSNVVMRRVSRASAAAAGGGVDPAGGSVSYQCDFCERIFGSKSHLQSHLVTHTGERAFNCRLCQKTFGRKSTLRAHMTTHTKTSNFMCTVCEKACNDNNSLEEHIRMHTGGNNFSYSCGVGGGRIHCDKSIKFLKIPSEIVGDEDHNSRCVGIIQPLGFVIHRTHYLERSPC